MAKIHLADEGDFVGHEFTRPACGTARGFNHEGVENECVSPKQGHQITCKRCRLIYMRRIMNNEYVGKQGTI